MSTLTELALGLIDPWRAVLAVDVRRLSGFQDFVDTAPLDLICVADPSRMKRVPI